MAQYMYLDNCNIANNLIYKTMKKYKFDFIDKEKNSLQVFYIDKDQKISNLLKAKYLAKNILATTKLNDLYKIIVTIEK